MREIKFRAWVPSEKAMISHREVIERAHLQFNDSLSSPDVVMQYVGHKDKFGREIYEGDIITHSIHKLPFVTKWRNDCMCTFQFHQQDRNIWEPCNPSLSHEIEVIGNIYENPEIIR